jgi:hypothetical protein
MLQDGLSRAGPLFSLKGPISKETAEYARDKAEFVDHAKRFTEWMNAEHKAVLRELMGDGSKHLDVIRRPGIHRMLVARNNPRYASPDWQRTLACFPDKAAMGRWARIILWYAVQHAAGRTRGFENNYEDSHYLFTASYTRHLVTEDVALQRAVAALFPYVRIIRE